MASSSFSGSLVFPTEKNLSAGFATRVFLAELHFHFHYQSSPDQSLIPLFFEGEGVVKNPSSLAKYGGVHWVTINVVAAFVARAKWCHSYLIRERKKIWQDRKEGERGESFPAASPARPPCPPPSPLRLSRENLLVFPSRRRHGVVRVVRAAVGRLDHEQCIVPPSSSRCPRCGRG